VSISARAERITQSRAAALIARLGDYYELGKPRIMYLLLTTTAAAMLMAAHGMPAPALFAWTMLGGALAAMSAGTLNCVYDADIDRVMRRTQTRPIPALRISIFAATMHAIVMGVLSFSIFYFRVNSLAAWLSLAGNVYYVVIYTMWLKRRTPQNIVIGGAAGAIPPLVGWAAVTNSIGGPAIGLFAIIFLWTPPHFWALALNTENDYAKAAIPMLPNVVGERRTKRAIFSYTIVLAAATLALFPLHVMGGIYLAGALALGSAFIWFAWRLLRDGESAARALFRFSLVYLALICAFMVIDRIVL
jgi:protoheme IX farnesyltransferase